MQSLARTIILLAALALSSASAQQSGPPAAFAAAVAATEAARAAYAFDFEMDVDQRTWRARFDPHGEPKLAMVDPPYEQLSNGARRTYQNIAERMQGVSWCASEAMARVTDVRLLREDESTATYAFQPTAESIEDRQMRPFADRMRGEATLTKGEPDFARVRIFTPAAFSPFPLVQVERVNIDITCAPAPNGRRYAAHVLSEARGAAFGEVYDERAVQRALNLTPAP